MKNEQLAIGGWRLARAMVPALLLAACAVPAPYERPEPPTTPAPETPVQTQPGQPPTTVEEPQPLPPAVQEPTLSAASRSLVGQAQTQLATKNYAAAAASLERALRIEPVNPLLRIELGKVRLAEGNYVQAENMGRHAVSLAANAPRAQASAWRVIAESYRARGKNIEAREAEARAQALSSR